MTWLIVEQTGGVEGEARQDPARHRTAGRTQGNGKGFLNMHLQK